MPNRERIRNRAAWPAVGLLAMLAGAVALAGRVAGDPAPAAAVGHPDQLVVLSTSDVKGKTGPCGCHVPKGGFARREAFADSLRREFGQTLVVDCGGWFPDADTTYRDLAAFQADELGRLRVDAVGTSDRELAFGLGFLRALVERSGTPLVCANLYDARHRLVFPPSRLLHVGGVTVGVLSLISDQASLGPAHDSLTVEEPTAAAHRVVADLRARGASVVVLLSNLGKVASEDLANALTGIDVMIVGRNVPVIEHGRLVNHTVTCYGGEQGHYVGVTHVALDAHGAMAGGDNSVVMLGPDVPDDPGALARVKAFEDAFNEKLRSEEQAAAARAASSTASGPEEDPPSHYLGAELCRRCHPAEYAQWLRTPHAGAWRSLAAEKKDAMPECVSCHVLGDREPGGFRTAADAPALGGVQCESCHGMGTEHDGWPARAPKVEERTCRHCHTDEESPTFDFALYRPHVLHQAPGDLPALPPHPRNHGSMR